MQYVWHREKREKTCWLKSVLRNILQREQFKHLIPDYRTSLSQLQV